MVTPRDPAGRRVLATLAMVLVARIRPSAAGLADARIAILPGQQHAAMHSAPERFVAAVVQCLDAVSPAVGTIPPSL